ncbi:MAG: ankyrin repeat domain-containing protein [Alphaproteobacteria bacterium]|nr:MAG: ankyrin repeat domain-containing protein [Alphaproteobacteria bacterium]
MNFAKKLSAPFQRALERPLQKRKDHELFLGAVTNSSWSLMKDLVKKYPEAVAWRDEKGLTALHHAAGYGAVTAIEFLLAHGANIEAADKAGLRPLHHAAESLGKNAGAAIEALLEKGAHIDARNKRGTTPLLYALLRNRASNAEILAAAGAVMNAANETGNTPLKEASFRKRLAPQLDLALKNGAAKRLHKDQGAARAAEEVFRKNAIAEAVESIGKGLADDIVVMRPVRLVR